jgi:hypothetical protein
MLRVWAVEVRKLQMPKPDLVWLLHWSKLVHARCARPGNIGHGSSQMSLTRTAAASLGTAIVALVAVSAASVVATAADSFACQDYAERAVLQYKSMQNVKGCKRADDARWNGNFNTHKSWCLKARESLLESEDRARGAYLAKCGQGGGKIDPG